MAYEITKACEIENKEFAVGDIIEDETSVNFFPSVMRKVESKSVAEAPKGEDTPVLTKAKMLEKIKEIKFVGDLTDEQKAELKTITGLNVPELRVVYEKVIAEAPKGEDA